MRSFKICCVAAPSTNFEMYCKLLTGLKLLNSISSPGYFNNGETGATFHSLGKWPVDKETLIMDVNTGSITSIYCRIIFVGIVSAEQDI